ncbi:MAG: twin-arginine translocase TatA/TatE family subunit [Thermodesulfovibrionales bacterium]|nr:twin-arginine translocase TatA/TatE family subunit [Thermodesulfovibrionales bacterium]
MFGLGMQELIIILVIVLVLFGATRLPEIGKGIGQAIRNFRKGMSEPDEIDVTPKKESKKEKIEKKEEAEKKEGE